MKRMLMATTVTLSVLLIASFPNKVSAQPRTDVSINYQTFYDELDPYGRWMDYPDYGYVWIPDAGNDFRPYGSSGHWVWSDDYEWMWVSDYNWGWAPFHYGRWMQDPYYGWFWVPGYEWSPAWVAWRDGGDYYGWAPLRPGINISIGFNLGGYNPPSDYWCFSPRRYITHRNVYNYCAPRQNNVTIINQTTIINNYNYNRNVFRTGPGRRQAEQYTGRINPVRFRDASRPGRTSFRNNEVSVYRPNVQRDNNRSFTPRRVQQFDRDRSTASNNSNGNNIRRPENGNGNNLPRRREGTINRDRPFNRDNNNPRRNENGIAERPRTPRDQNANNGDGQQGHNNTRPRVFERPERNNNGNNNRVERNEAPQRNQRPDIARPRVFERQQQNNNNSNGGDRRIERRQMGGGNESRPQRQEQPRVEQPRQQQPRQFEQPRQQQPRQMEQRRTESRTESRTENRGGGNSGGGRSGGGFGRRDR